METKKTVKSYSPEVKERAVRMVIVPVSNDSLG
jgi:transposase-like protein